MHDLKYYSTYNPTQLKKNSSDVFNDVQKDGLAMLSSKTRPDMIIMTLHEYEDMINHYEGKISLLGDLVSNCKLKSKGGDSHLQEDLLK